MTCCLMNECDKLPYSIQYLADYDSFLFYFFFFEKGGAYAHLAPACILVHNVSDLDGLMMKT